MNSGSEIKPLVAIAETDEISSPIRKYNLNNTFSEDDNTEKDQSMRKEKKKEQKKTGGHASIGGMKTIGTISSLMLIINTCTGPGFVQIPPAYQQAGWFSTNVMMIFVLFISCVAAVMIVEAMALVPGNEFFQDRIEFASLSKQFFNKPGYWLTNFLLQINLQAFNIASIIASAQTMDQTLVAVFGTTCGLEFYPHPGIQCVHNFGQGISPFNNVYILSFGFVVVFLLCLPMGLLNLDDNMWVQWASVLLFSAIVVQWSATIILSGVHFDYTPFWGNSQTQVLGTIMFNFNWAYVIPSWINEMKKGVSVNLVVWGSSIFCGAFYIFIGMLGAWYSQYTDNKDLLSVINLSTHLRILCMISVYIFPVPAFLSGVPVNSIVVKYNLLNSNICNVYWANFWGVIFPWIVSVPFYTGAGFADVINWSSLIAGGFINYVIPMFIYIFALRDFSKRERKQIPENINAVEDDEVDNQIISSSIASGSGLEVTMVGDSSGINSNLDDTIPEKKKPFSLLVYSRKQPKKTKIHKPYRVFPEWKWLTYKVKIAITLVLIAITSIIMVIVIIDNIVQGIIGLVQDIKNHSF